MELYNQFPAHIRDQSPQGAALLDGLRVPRPTTIAYGRPPTGEELYEHRVTCWSQSKIECGGWAYPKRPWEEVIRNGRIDLPVESTAGTSCCSVDLDDPDVLDPAQAAARIAALPAKDVPANLARLGTKLLFVINFLYNNPH